MHIVSREATTQLTVWLGAVKSMKTRVWETLMLHTYHTLLLFHEKENKLRKPVMKMLLYKIHQPIMCIYYIVYIFF